MSTEPAGRWELAITCPRPRNRARDDFHVQPERVANTAAMLLGAHAELALTARTVRFSITRSCPVTDVAYWQKQLALALDCLWLDVESDGRHGYRLPRPVRVELRETDAEDFPAGKGREQTPPAEEAGMT